MMNKEAKAAQEKTVQSEEQTQEQLNEQISDEQFEEVAGGNPVSKEYLKRLDNQTITQPESSDDFNNGPLRSDIHY